tara:strand:- start:155 stop:685 length:531 start_codon:yes stop_codon:yes gene_type:complete
MFASITPLLISGAIAERMKFRSFMLFVVLFEIFVYYPMAHTIWGGGFLADLGTQDFAGGIVIHATAGASSLVAAYILGPRMGVWEQKTHEFPPHNIPMAALGKLLTLSINIILSIIHLYQSTESSWIGASLLWMGWFGFNAGSAYAADFLAAVVVANTTIGNRQFICPRTTCQLSQ